MNAGTSAEAVQANLTVEIQRASAAETALAGNLAAETARATAAEDAEVQSRAEADQALNDALDGKLDKTEAAATFAVKSDLPDMSAYAKTLSPAFTGTPTAPTPPSSSWDQRLATTAFVRQLLGSVSPDTSGLVASTSVREIVALSQDSYDALPDKPASTLYVLID